MKTIVMYYSLGGKTKAEAERIAAEKNAEIYEVQELKKRGFFNALFKGCPSSMKREASEIKALRCNLDEYDKIIIGAPVWGGFPAPAFNAMLNFLPAGKDVELFICSAGGETPKSEQGTKELIQSKGCTLISYNNIKTGK
jgi:menaquinone-dependent protoporphyrinogen IX oxidase